jgi:hypothetical protein
LRTGASVQLFFEREVSFNAYLDLRERCDLQFQLYPRQQIQRGYKIFRTGVFELRGQGLHSALRLAISPLVARMRTTPHPAPLLQL